jgi:bidirectional [NiFe] hydrogenase diaphorase subunit
MKNIVNLKIDNQEVKVDEGANILEAASIAGIEIPTLCYDEGLEPYGACRLCVVEVETKHGYNMVTSCCYPASEGLNVRTRSVRIDRTRKTILELAAASAGEDVGRLAALADEYGADLSRFRKKIAAKQTKCILCGLCVRRCTEATGNSAIGFISRGTSRQIVLFPEMEKACSNCSYCRTVCPTGRITSVGVYPRFPYFDDILAGRVQI